MQRETKTFKFTVEETNDEKGTFTGYASIWDVIDSYGDVVVKGAFKKTIKEKKAFPVLWSHWPTEPMGVIVASEDDRGLFVEGALNLDVQRSREVRSIMRQMKEAEIPMGMSIGFNTVKDDWDRETGIRKLKEIRLWEISLCVFPALDPARVADVKADDPEFKPYANEHAARLRDPDDFVRIRQLWAKEDLGIRAIGGPLKSDPEGGTVEQAIRFKASKWTPDEAKQWLKDHDYKWIDFEEATGKCLGCPSHKALPGGEPDPTTPDDQKPLSDHDLAEIGEAMKSSVDYTRSLLQN
jgi:hypothetical protein